MIEIEITVGDVTYTHEIASPVGLAVLKTMLEGNKQFAGRWYARRLDTGAYFGPRTRHVDHLVERAGVAASRGLRDPAWAMLAERYSALVVAASNLPGQRVPCKTVGLDFLESCE